MPRANPLISSLNAGELSPRMLARTDFAKYRNGCRTLVNMLPLAQGGAARRPGLRFVAEVKDSTKITRPLPFEYSTEQAYLIEAGEGYFRFFKDQGRIVVADTAAAISNGTFTGNITGWTDESGAGGSIAHDATNDRLSLISDGVDAGHAEQQVTNAAAQEHVLRFRVFGVAGDTVALRIGTTTTGAEITTDTDYGVGYHGIAFTSTAADFFVQFLNSAAKTLQIDDVSLIDDATMEIGNPYLEAELFSLRRAQSDDTFYLTHVAHHPMKLLRGGHTIWSLVEIDFTDGPYLDANTDTTKTLQPSAVTGLGITITAAGHSPFASTDVGRLVRIVAGYAVITGFTSATVVDADVRVDFAATTAQSDWRHGSWSGTTGYPAAVGFHQQRLYFGGSGNEPDRLWGSKLGDFENHTPGVDDDDPVDFTISSDLVNAIRWLRPVRQMAIGTQGSENLLSANTLDDPVTPTSIRVFEETSEGCDAVEPVRVGKTVLYMQRFGRKLEEFAADPQSILGGFVSNDLTILAEHVTESGIVDLAYQAHPDNTVWAVRADGVAAALTYKRAEDVVGWSRQITNAASSGDKIEGCAVIPGTGRDEVWVVANRTIGGATKRFMEFLEAPLADDAPPEDAFHVDSGLTLDNTVNATLTPGATSGSGVTFTAGSSVFVSGDVDREIRYRYATTPDIGGRSGFATATATITIFTDDQNVVADINVDFPDTNAIAANAWRMTVTSVSGLDHLEGETVQVLGDGAVQSDQVVASGAITLASPAATVHAGLGYSSVYESLKLEAGAPAGTAQGQPKRYHGVTLLLLRSGSIKAGAAADDLQVVPSRSVDDPMDAPPPLFTGEKYVSFKGDFETDPRIFIVQDSALPLTLLGLVPHLKTGAK